MKGELITTGDVARVCSVTTETVVSWIKSGKLQACCTPGGRYRISLKDCVSFLSEYGLPVPDEWRVPDNIAYPQSVDQENSDMDQLVLPKACLPELVASLGKSYTVYAPAPRGKTSAFEEVSDGAALQLDYVTTILPVKKLLLPPREKLLDFDIASGTAREPEPPRKPVAVVGIHPCDMQGVLRLDYAFRKGHPESNYFGRRNKMLFIGTSCNPDEFCFCDAVGTNNFAEGFDVFLTDIGQSYLVDVLTSRGRDAVKGLKTQPVTDIDLREARKTQARCTNHPGRKMAPKASTLPLLAKDGQDLELWEQVGKRCLSCGTCNLVCPTCYCFDVRDEVSLNLTKGERARFWDSCQFDEFAEVAGGESFRKDRKNRQKHRFNRKFRYLMAEYGAPFCVGCGRCGRQCVAKIDIAEIANDLEKAVAKL